MITYYVRIYIIHFQINKTNLQQQQLQQIPMIFAQILLTTTKELVTYKPIDGSSDYHLPEAF